MFIEFSFAYYIICLQLHTFMPGVSSLHLQPYKHQLVHQDPEHWSISPWTSPKLIWFTYMLLWYYKQYSTLAVITYPYNVNIYKFIKFITICSRLKNDPPKDIHLLIPITWECYLIRQKNIKEGWGLEDVIKDLEMKSLHSHLENIFILFPIFL